MALFNFTPINKRTQKPKALPKLDVDYELNKRTEQPAPLPNVGGAFKAGAFALTDKGSGGEQAIAGGRVKRAPTGSMSSGSGSYSSNGDAPPVPRVKAGDAKEIADKSGLKGMGLDNQFIGLTFAEARQKAEELRQERASQVSANTSFSYNPESISGFKNTFKDLQLRVKETSNDPFESRESKTKSKDALISSYTSNLAKNFGSVDEFNAAQQDPEFAKILSEYEKIGGSRNDIASNISKSVSVVSETPNRDGSYTVTYSDGTQDVRRYTQNADGSFTSTPAQTIDQYLGAMTSPDQKKAMEELLPEYTIQQDKIAFEQSIPNQYRDYYFGNEEQVGFLQQQKTLAEEKIKILEKEAKTEEKNLKRQANLVIEKNQYEQEKDEAEIEENRLQAKNYATGLLAKLGALKTTGAAVEGLANLEQKYQQQTQETKRAYYFANKEVENKLIEGLDDIDNKLANDIWDIKNDLSKDEETVWKDIFKMQQTADRNTLNIIDKFAGEFRTLKEKYRKERIAEAKKYADTFSSIIGADDLKGVMEGDIILKRNKKGKITDQGLLNPEGQLSDIERILEGSKGSDGYVNSRTYEQTFNSFIKAGGTRNEFLKQFPPNQYVNPKDPTLPSFLKFGSSVRSEAEDEDEREI